MQDQESEVLMFWWGIFWETNGGFRRLGVPQKWIVKIMENFFKMDDLGGTTIFGNTQMEVEDELGFFQE